MDLQLTNIEHFSECDIQAKIKQLRVSLSWYFRPRKSTVHFSNTAFYWLLHMFILSSFLESVCTCEEQLNGYFIINVRYTSHTTLCLVLTACLSPASQSFQQEISLTTAKIEHIFHQGEALIEKSEPLDAAVIEEELEELQRYCQEVFGRVERYYKKLIRLPVRPQNWENLTDLWLGSKCNLSHTKVLYL